MLGAGSTPPSCLTGCFMSMFDPTTLSVVSAFLQRRNHCYLVYLNQKVNARVLYSHIQKYIVFLQPQN